MADKFSPEFQFLVWPQSAIPQKTAQPFAIADDFGTAPPLKWSDTDGLEINTTLAAQNPTITVPWAAQPHYTNLNNCWFVRFYKNGRVRFGNSEPEGEGFDGEPDVAGWMIRPRIAALDSKVGSTTLDTSATNQTWNAMIGDWETTLPPAGATIPFTKILCKKLSTAGEGIAMTPGDIPLNRSLYFELFSQQAATFGLPSAQIIIGHKWALNFRHGSHLVLARKNNQSGAAAAFDNYKTFSDGPKINLAGGSYAIHFMRVAGRGVISITDGAGATWAWWFLDTRDPLTSYAGQGNVKIEAREVTWPAAPLFFNVYGAHARLGMGVIKWSASDGTPFTASFTRRVRCYTALSATPIVTTAGWEREGTSIAATATLNTNDVSYTATLTANADGIDSPLVAKATVRYPLTWGATESSPPYLADGVSPLDIRAAVLGADVTLALPPLAAGSMATIAIDRNLLESQCPTWASYIEDFSPVQILARWLYDDGSYGDWATLFFGYLHRPEKSLESWHDGAMKLVCLDEVIRLKRPAAILDHRVPPLDIKFAEIAATATPTPGTTTYNVRMFGGQAAMFLLEHFIGTAYADNINGNGDYNRYFPSGHSALIDNTTDHCGYLTIAATLGVSTTLPPLTRGAWRFPVRHGSDAYSWLADIATEEKAIFFFERGVFYWGRLTEILRTRTPRTIPDKVYVNGDLSRVASYFSTSFKPERAINAVTIVGKEAQGLEGFLPSLRIGHAELGSSDANRAALTWERTHYAMTPLALLDAEVIAAGIIARLADVRAEYPTVRYRGDEAARAGDVLTFKLSGTASDTTIGLDDLSVRAETILHKLTCDKASTFITEATCRPLTAEERTAVGL